MMGDFNRLHIINKKFEIRSSKQFDEIMWSKDICIKIVFVLNNLKKPNQKLIIVGQRKNIFL